MPGAVLVHATSWIGDGVMSLAALRSLKQAFPEARLSVLARPSARDLYAGCEAVDETLVYDREGEHRGARGFFRAAREIRERAFDLAILFPNAFRAAALVFTAGIPERWGYATDGRGFLLTRAVPPAPRPFGRHQVFYYLDLLRALGIAVGPPDTHLSLTAAMRAGAEALLVENGRRAGEKLFGLHPGATNSTAKRWIADRFAALGEKLSHAYEARLVVLAGPGEEGLAEDVRRGLSTSPVFLAGRTRLSELMGVLGSLSLFVSNDSGPMHVAAALGVPTLAVFGPTDERETGPWGGRARVVRERVDCSPCLLRTCPIDHRCMTRLDVDAVYGAAASLLAGAGAS